jgi:uncharacterized membrane protein YdjX (TVP38/TMEM64 family)
MKGTSKRLLLLALFIGVIAALRFSPIGDALTLENLQKHRDALLDFVHARFALSIIVYIAVYIVVVAFSLPGGAVMTLAGGYLFGTVVAVPCVVVGATTGALLAFLSARYLVGDRLQQAYTAQLERFNREMERNGIRYLLTLRLIPIFPFFLVNFLAGLTRVPFTAFAWTTAAGIVPGTIVYAFAGQQLETVRSIGDILSPRVLLAFVVLALFTLAPALFDRLRKR